MGEPREEEGSLEDSLQDSVVREALEGGLDLRDYSKLVKLLYWHHSKLSLSRQIEDELAAAEKASIADYISQSGNIAQLHNQVTIAKNHLRNSCKLEELAVFQVSSCDSILARMENLLLSFQSDLGSISTEILSLQQQSVEMNLRLKNRQAVRKK